MSVQTATANVVDRKRPMTREEKRVILASSAGTIFEWYDFYLYGSLAAIIGAQFFSAFPEATRNVFALLAFAAGFLVRPFGALFFGRLGDLVGRKYTFLMTILIMGASTFIVGLLPGYETIGWVAPVILIALRMLQGLALGGEYGGAVVYVAEHAPHGRRGFFTSWIQTTATLGLLLSLMVILAVRSWTGEADFAAWGWRIPFLLSIFLLGISVWIRMQMEESPAFKKMKEEGTQSKAPLSEAFGQWKNAKFAVIALFGLVAGQAVVWYTGQFYALFFLQSILRVDMFTANVLIAWSLILGTAGFVFFGSLSDRIGRKPIILAGCLLAAITYFPVFKYLTEMANPMLAKAQQTTKVTVIADKDQCSFQFNPTGTSKFTSSCDITKALLARSSVSYSVEDAPDGSVTKVRIGDKEVMSYDVSKLTAEQAKTVPAAFTKAVNDALGRSGLSGPRRRQCRNRQDVELLRHFPRADARHRAGADLPRGARHHGVRPDRGGAGRTLPDPHPLHRHVVALPHRQRVVRRPDAGDGLRDDRPVRRYLLRALVSDRDRPCHLRHRHDLRAGEQGPGHLRGR